MLSNLATHGNLSSTQFGMLFLMSRIPLNFEAPAAGAKHQARQLFPKKRAVFRHDSAIRD
jgi:hypothetical protein